MIAFTMPRISKTIVMQSELSGAPYQPISLTGILKARVAMTSINVFIYSELETVDYLASMIVQASNLIVSKPLTSS
jgi:hypothetical protein